MNNDRSHEVKHSLSLVLIMFPRFIYYFEWSIIKGIYPADCFLESGKKKIQGWDWEDLFMVNETRAKAMRYLKVFLQVNPKFYARLPWKRKLIKIELCWNNVLLCSGRRGLRVKELWKSCWYTWVRRGLLLPHRLFSMYFLGHKMAKKTVNYEQ